MSTKGIKREMWSLQWNIATNPDKALRPTAFLLRLIAVGEQAVAINDGDVEAGAHDRHCARNIQVSIKLGIVCSNKS